MLSKYRKNKALILSEMLAYGAILAGLIWYFLPQALQ